MKNFPFIILLNLLSLSVFAITNEQLIEACFEVGQKKIISQAKSLECEIYEEETEVIDIDNRWYNPHKYLWFFAPGECMKGQGLQKLVQYHNGKCF